MKNYKKVSAIVITAVAITGSASALANASSAKSRSDKSSTSVDFKKMADKSGKLNKENHGMRGMDGDKFDGPRRGFGPAELEPVVTATLGIDATTLRSRLAAGETLAAIAGAKKDALITALVAEMTKRIDADVTAGKLTADQAKNLKANLTAHVTEEINEVHKPGMGHMGGKGRHGHDHDDDGDHNRDDDGDDDHGMGRGPLSGTTNGIPNTSNN